MDQLQLQKLLKRYNITPSRSRGQNFLLDEEVIQRMVTSAGVIKDDLVVEIGPGLGVLTTALCSSAKKVLSIELDTAVISAIKEQLLPKYPNLTLHEGDALSANSFHARAAWIADNLSSRAACPPEPRRRREPRDLTHDIKSPEYKHFLKQLDFSYKIVANLPYQITSRFLRSILEDAPRPSTLVVMLQKEVAERATAKAGEMSLLSLAVQAYATARVTEIVKADAFYPQPEVDSAVLHCDLTKPDAGYMALSDEQRELFWRLAKAGYASRRKQLKNNLAHVLRDKTIEEIVALLASLNLSSTVRAQELSVSDWCALVKAVET